MGKSREIYEKKVRESEDRVFGKRREAQGKEKGSQQKHRSG